MAGLLPTTPAFQSVNIKNNQPSLVSISTSGRKQVKSQQAQFWSFTAVYPPMTRTQFGSIAGHLAKQRGALNDFTVRLPEYSTTSGALTTEPVTLTNSESVGATQIELTSGSLNMTGALKAGDFVRFENFTKVYMVTEDVDFVGGSATMNIEPGLLNASVSGDTLDYKDVEFTVFLESNVQEFQTGLANLVRFEFDMREAI